MIIDHIEGYNIGNTKNLHSLNYMKDGLNLLASYMLHYEELNKQSPLMKGCVFSMMGTGIEENYKICLYMWFSNTLVSYVQLIGTLVVMEQKGWKLEDIHEHRKEIKKFSSKYIESTIPEVKIWRDKVFAHFSLTDPRTDDNLGLLQHSVINPLSWNGENYVIGAFQRGIGNEQANLPEWSITKKYEELIPRYWPGTKKVNNKKEEN